MELIRFVVTTKGYSAKVPDLAQEGDIIYVVLGSSKPFVLRQQCTKNKLVGRHFVHGYVEGKAMYKLNEACQKFLGGKKKSELSEDVGNGLKVIVDQEL